MPLDILAQFQPMISIPTSMLAGGLLLFPWASLWATLLLGSGEMRHFFRNHALGVSFTAWRPFRMRRKKKDAIGIPGCVVSETLVAPF